MAPPPGKKTKRTVSGQRRSSAPPPMRTVHLSHADQASITSLMTKKLRPLAGLAASFTAICAAAAAIWGAWTFLDGPKLVTDHGLKSTIETVKTDVGRKIDTTRVEVIDIGNKNTTEVKNDVNDVKKVLNALSRQSTTNNSQMLELQQRTLFVQKSNLQAQLSSIVAQLHDRPADAFLLQRKSEIEGIAAYVDREMATVQSQLAASRLAPTRGD